MVQWPWQSNKMECSHLIKYNGTNLEISGLSFQGVSLGKLAIEQKLLQTVSHALMLIDGAQYHFCQAVKNAPDEESKKKYYDLMMQDKVRSQDIWMGLAALTISPDSKEVEESLIKMILQNHNRALQVEQGQEIHISKEQIEVDTPNTVEIGSTSLNQKIMDLEKSHKLSPRSNESQVNTETGAKQITNSGLLLLLTRKFSKEGLKTLCFQYDIDYDEIGGNTKEEMARELIRYLKERDKLGDFYSYLTDYLARRV
jgi:hypothetical protein